MKPEDDERSITYAPHHIRELYKKLTGLEEKLKEFREKYQALVKKVEWIQTAAAEADKRMERRMAESERGVDARLSALEKSISNYGVPFGAPEEFSEPIGRSPETMLAEHQRRREGRKPEEYSAAVGEYRDGAIHLDPKHPKVKAVLSQKNQPDLDDELDGIPDVHGRQGWDGRPKIIDDPLIPEGIAVAMGPGAIQEGGPTKKPRLGGLFAIGDPTRGVVPHEVAEELRRQGRVQALAEAEDRVLDKLSQMGWAPGSPAMLGVVNALRGTKPIKDNPQG